MSTLTISGVADSWSDRPDYKWQCGEQRPCWVPIAATVMQALGDATYRGCTHAGRIVMRHRTVAVGPWNPLSGPTTPDHPVSPAHGDLGRHSEGQER